MTRAELEAMLANAFPIEATEKKVPRAEWIAICAFGLNILTLVFGAGIYVNTITEQGKDIASLQSEVASDRRDIIEIKVTLAEIRADTKTLAERAREDRERMR